MQYLIQNLQRAQGCQSMKCGIWYNIDKVVIKGPVKKNPDMSLMYNVHVSILRTGPCLLCIYRVMDIHGKLGEHEDILELLARRSQEQL